jgi:hypothetical protein
MAILFGVIMLLTTVMGVLAVDVGYLLASRRDAQADADFIALAGAIELPDFDAGDQEFAANAARDAAKDWALRNGVDPDSELALQVLWNDECYPGEGDALEAYVGVKATVTREPFTVFLGFVPGIGSTLFDSTATACSGTPQAMRRFMPWGLPQDGACFEDGIDPETGETIRVPILGERCVLSDGQGVGGPNYAQLGFDTSSDDCPDGSQGASDYENAIINGVALSCALGEYASSQSGANVGKTRSALEERLTGDGQCDDVYPGDQATLTADSDTFEAAGFTPLESPAVDDFIDDLFEIWKLPANYNPPGWGGGTDPAAGLRERTCSSVRNITLLVIESVDPADPHSSECSSNTCYEILGFARMYIEGCSEHLELLEEGDFSRTCSGLTGNDFIIYGRLITSDTVSAEDLGFNRVGNQQTFLKE